MLKVLRAKLHQIRVTGSDLDYHGSITLDPVQCQEAGIYPLEFVEIWNKNSGSRISTYVIYGEPGSRCCVLNGAAARACQVGDELIVCACEFVHGPEELAEKRPAVLLFNKNNEIARKLEYRVSRKDGGMDFEVVEHLLP